MLVEDHLRPAATKAAFFLLAEIGTDSKTIQDIQRWVDPSIMLKVYAHSRMDKRHGGSGKDDRSHGPERGNRSTVHSVGVGDRPWVILPVSCCRISPKFFGKWWPGTETPAFSVLRYAVF